MAKMPIRPFMSESATWTSYGESWGGGGGGGPGPLETKFRTSRTTGEPSSNCVSVPDTLRASPVD